MLKENAANYYNYIKVKIFFLHGSNTEAWKMNENLFLLVHYNSNQIQWIK